LSLRTELETVSLLASDIVVIKTTDTEIMGFRNGAATGIAISGTEASTARPNTVIEVLIGPDSRPLGKTIGRLRWRRRYGVYPMALHRKGNAIDLRLSTQRIEVGDTLLLDGAVEDITRLSEDEKLIVLSTLTSRAYRRKKAPIAIGIMAGVVGLAALNVAPILTLSLIGAALAFLTKCVDPDEGMESIDGRLLLLIVSMLILGVALDRSGALKLIIDSVTPFLLNAHPLVALAVVYAATSILTEVITNNAVAVVMTPIAAGIAIHLGYDPRCFVVAAMFGASASFSTPIGYQTNTLVYNAGGYRFTDFLRIGIPMNLICGITTVLIAPLIWPLVP
jgi:di/tricarboxylate transporter